MASAADANDEFAIVGEAPGVFLAGMSSRVAITAWLGPRLDAGSIQAFVDVTETILRRFGSKRGAAIHMLNHRVHMPDPAVRPTIVRMMHASARLSAVSVLIEGSGFWASAFRGFVTGLRLLGPSSYRLHEHATVAELCTWLPAEHHKVTGEPIDPVALERWVLLAKSWQESHDSGNSQAPSRR
jgi:hypothetical protein